MLKVKINLNQELNLEIIQKFTNELEKFSSDVFLWNQNQQANCKSLINLLAIGLGQLKILEFEIIGQDEIDVSEFLKKFFNNY